MLLKWHFTKNISVFINEHMDIFFLKTHKYFVTIITAYKVEKFGSLL